MWCRSAVYVWKHKSIGCWAKGTVGERGGAGRQDAAVLGATIKHGIGLHAEDNESILLVETSFWERGVL